MRVVFVYRWPGSPGGSGRLVARPLLSLVAGGDIVGQRLWSAVRLCWLSAAWGVRCRRGVPCSALFFCCRGPSGFCGLSFVAAAEGEVLLGSFPAFPFLSPVGGLAGLAILAVLGTSRSGRCSDWWLEGQRLWSAACSAGGQRLGASAARKVFFALSFFFF